MSGLIKLLDIPKKKIPFRKSSPTWKKQNKKLPKICGSKSCIVGALL
jgi:hypothetical protein